jgi:hypothetical protein
MRLWLEQTKMDIVFGVILFFIAIPLAVWYLLRGYLEEPD